MSRYASTTSVSSAKSKAEAEPLDEGSLKSMIWKLGNQIHNLGCEYQGDEILSTRLEELRSEAWRLAGAAPVSPASEAEPVAWMYQDGDRCEIVRYQSEAGLVYKGPGWIETPLYAAPVSPTAQQATDEGEGRGRLFAALEDAEKLESIGCMVKCADLRALLATPQPTETQRIVAWLRGADNGLPDLDRDTTVAARQAVYCLDLADAIERGEHLAGSADQWRAAISEAPDA